MRHYLIYKILVCMALLFVFAPNLFGASPEILFQEDVYTFRPILEGESVHINFEFSNGGGGNLVIYDAATSCGCTTADYPSHSLEPGEKGTIKTTFHSRGHGGDNDITLLVKSNDPSVPVKTLRIRGRVIRQWQAKPDRFILTNLKPDRSYTRKLQINNFMDKKLQIRELSAGNPHIDLLFKPKVVSPKGNKVIAFRIRVDDFMGDGIAQSSIRIEVANAKMQSVEIPILMKLK
jgi:hypothetical protein